MACRLLIPPDHAWTYRVESARQQLLEIPELLIWMASLMGLPFHGEAPDPDVVDLVLDSMWKYNQTYQLSQGICCCSLQKKRCLCGTSWMNLDFGFSILPSRLAVWLLCSTLHNR
ncbi:tubulin--tyrosine ligase-like protein 12 [Sinocyclocheilus grahami]|uniref:tubulin--tyrosine ligase-like protein 12 n=1 Tax=Sinocyclocheilus grahami TaxID=75366 RepID=UPI0007ACE53D|nr:PREDICTED: tubulin--tyrosine ligase-like protein 12 [Sinocyclocheilus grahami]